MNFKDYLVESLNKPEVDKKLFSVKIFGNIYSGKYYEYSNIRPEIEVLAVDAEDIIKVLNNNKEEILKKLADRKIGTRSYVKKPIESNVWFFNGGGKEPTVKNISYKEIDKPKTIKVYK